MAPQSSLSVASDYQSKELQLTAMQKLEDLFPEISSDRADVSSNLNLCQAELDCVTEKMVVVVHQTHAPEKTPMEKKMHSRTATGAGAKNYNTHWSCHCIQQVCFGFQEAEVNWPFWGLRIFSASF